MGRHRRMHEAIKTADWFLDPGRRDKGGQTVADGVPGDVAGGAWETRLSSKI